MAVRQYIGARYTTKVYENSQDASSAEWEANVTYEPLTLVTYLNSSYLSKKNVPPSIGEPATNPTYWVITGAYNGQIAVLQQQINTLDGLVAGHTTQIGDNTADITTLEGQMSSLNLLVEDNTELVASQWDFADGDVINVAKTGQYFIVTSTSTPISIQLANGKYAELLPDFDGFYNLIGLEFPTNTDISPILTYLFSVGAYNIKLDENTYECNSLITLNAPLSPLRLIGAGKTKTKIRCNSSFLKIEISGATFIGSEISNFTLSEVNNNVVGGDYNGIEIVSVNSSAADMLDECYFHDLIIERFATGFRIVCRTIYNRFEDMLIHYCTRNFVYSENTGFGYFNCNSFKNCRFSGAQYQSCFLRGYQNHCISNVFEACAFEASFYTGDTSGGNKCELDINKVAATFVGCHFEKSGNGITNFVAVVGTNANARFSNCAFVNYPNHLLVNVTSMMVFEQSSNVNSTMTAWSDTGTTVINNTYSWE